MAYLQRYMFSVICYARVWCNNRLCD